MFVSSRDVSIVCGSVCCMLCCFLYRVVYVYVFDSLGLFCLSALHCVFAHGMFNQLRFGCCVCDYAMLRFCIDWRCHGLYGPLLYIDVTLMRPVLFCDVLCGLSLLFCCSHACVRVHGGCGLTAVLLRLFIDVSIRCVSSRFVLVSCSLHYICVVAVVMCCCVLCCFCLLVI